MPGGRRGTGEKDPIENLMVVKSTIRCMYSSRDTVRMCCTRASSKSLLVYPQTRLTKIHHRFPPSFPTSSSSSSSIKLNKNSLKWTDIQSISQSFVSSLGEKKKKKKFPYRGAAVKSVTSRFPPPSLLTTLHVACRGTHVFSLIR